LSLMFSPAKIRKCPNCGHENKIQSAIIESDGELIEVTPGTLRKVSKKAPQEWSIKEKEVFFAELRGYAAQHGYKNGWAAHKFREKFGVFPDKWMENIPASAIMSPGVALWIRSRQIAWVKAKSKATGEVPNHG